MRALVNGVGFYQGIPGTGKTYFTAVIALVHILAAFRSLVPLIVPSSIPGTGPDSEEFASATTGTADATVTDSTATTANDSIAQSFCDSTDFVEPRSNKSAPVPFSQDSDVPDAPSPSNV